MLQNAQMALDFLRYKKIKLVNIRAEDIVDGNPKLTLGLIWTIILHFQVIIACPNLKPLARHKYFQRFATMSLDVNVNEMINNESVHDANWLKRAKHMYNVAVGQTRQDPPIIIYNYLK